MPDNLPTDEEHDAHHAHRCIDCALMFTRLNRPAGHTAEGDLCEDCNAEHEIERDLERGEGDE